jgi:hypothetical protein
MFTGPCTGMVSRRAVGAGHAANSGPIVPVPVNLTVNMRMGLTRDRKRERTQPHRPPQLAVYSLTHGIPGRAMLTRNNNGRPGLRGARFRPASFGARLCANLRVLRVLCG